MDRISQVAPVKLYLISDGPRNEQEAEDVFECRRNVEEAITWPCQVVKNYADVNKGVYDRIGKGTNWVFSQEKTAIFLEDDNLPEISFFSFCEQMLNMYENDTRILWVCGTNYLKQYEPLDGSSYVFTRHMLPCGWASWSQKFTRFYDGELTLWGDEKIRSRIGNVYDDKRLFKQDKKNWEKEFKRISNSISPGSWDYQMCFTIRVHGLYGIVPNYNQIHNIGVDENSVHGGVSMSNIMTKRFCELATKPINFPLKHPKIVMTDSFFERKTGKIILLPLKYRLIGRLNSILKILLKIDLDESLIGTLKKRISIKA